MTTQRTRFRRLAALVALLLALGLLVATLVWWPYSEVGTRQLAPATAAGTGDGQADGPPPVAIRSEVLGALRPGVLTPVRLHLQNTTGSPVTVNRIRVEVTKVEAPRATDRLPCTTDDFAVRQLDRRSRSGSEAASPPRSEASRTTADLPWGSRLARATRTVVGGAVVRLRSRHRTPTRLRPLNRTDRRRRPHESKEATTTAKLRRRTSSALPRALAGLAVVLLVLVGGPAAGWWSATGAGTRERRPPGHRRPDPHARDAVRPALPGRRGRRRPHHHQPQRRRPCGSAASSLARRGGHRRLRRRCRPRRAARRCPGLHHPDQRRRRLDRVRRNGSTTVTLTGRAGHGPRRRERVPGRHLHRLPAGRRREAPPDRRHRRRRARTDGGPVAYGFWTGGLRSPAAAAARRPRPSPQGRTPTASVAGAPSPSRGRRPPCRAARPSPATTSSATTPPRSAPQPVLAGCTGTIAASTCTENSVPDGRWRYSVIPASAPTGRARERAQRRPSVDLTAPVNDLSLSSVTGGVALAGHHRLLPRQRRRRLPAHQRADRRHVGAARGSTTSALSGGTARGGATPAPRSAPGGGPYVSNPFSWTAAPPRRRRHRDRWGRRREPRARHAVRWPTTTPRRPPARSPTRTASSPVGR